MNLKINKVCHCIKKNKIEPLQTFQDKESAYKKAQEILRIMETKSCKTHTFFIKEQSGDLILDSKLNRLI
jgi:hypothetical protein